jgi:hypothetical protein
MSGPARLRRALVLPTAWSNTVFEKRCLGKVLKARVSRLIVEG